MVFSITWAGITQLVECQLPKLDVAGSNPVARSNVSRSPKGPPMGLFGRDESPPDSRPMPQPASKNHPSTSHPHSGEVTVISRPSKIEGAIRGSADVIVEGRVKGSIETNGSVVVVEAGTVDAKIQARSVTIAGTVRGDVSATEKIELKPTANARGNIFAQRIIIKEGAVFEGQVVMKGDKPAVTTGFEAPAKKSAPPEAESPPADDAKEASSQA
jgi:cytoskeletal protein CcmA (bactofilin family)